MPGDLERALVGHAEVADLLDVVAPELHPQGVLLRRREHVEDPATDGELATLLDQVGRGVADGHQGRGELLVGDLVARTHHDGLEVAQPLDDRLQQRPDRGDHEVELADGLVGGVRVRQPTQDRQPATDRVRARAQSLVREGLPGREHRHAGGPVRLLAAAARSSAWRVVAVTARTRRCRAIPAARKGISRHRG